MHKKLKIFLPFLMTQKKKGRKKEFNHSKKYPLNSVRMNRQNFRFNLGFQVSFSQSKKWNQKD